MVALWQAVLSDGRILTGNAQNSSDFLDALNDVGVSRHEIVSVNKIGRYLGRGFRRAKVDAAMSALYPKDYSRYDLTGRWSPV